MSEQGPGGSGRGPGDGVDPDSAVGAPSWGEPVPPAGPPRADAGASAVAERRRAARGGTTTTAVRPRPERRVRPPLPPRPAPVVISRRDRRRVRIVERFSGKRVRNRVGVWRRLRSTVLLIILGAILAAALAAVLAAIVAGLAVAFHHASGS